MMIDPQKAIDYVISREGELEENPRDPAGITKYGISLRFLKTLSNPKDYGIISPEITADDIRNLTLPQARDIYLKELWSKASFGRLANQNIANYLFDASINMGLSPAIKCAQLACAAVMHKKDVIAVDGILGQATLDMINHCAFYILPAMRSERAGHYRLIAQKNNDNEFIEGWLNRAYTGV